MQDLISRQAAIDAVNNLTYPSSLVDVKRILVDLPSAQPERKTGRWIYDNEAYPGGNPCGHYDCDQCGESVPHKTNFCPNCGAKMEVEHEDR